VPVAEPLTLERPEVAEDTWVARPWVVRVWNDPVNLMSYVTYVFQQHFGFDEFEAERLMWQVHSEGCAVVASGNRELMEMHVAAMHEYGLWATMEQG
jgi:ATP-dependent Clp protease adaptor protein ClpS